MRRTPLDLSATQLIASGLATLAAAVGASFLGVYGTIVGAAFMSVVSTAGTALGKHYLDQGKEQFKERVQLQDAAHGETVARGAAGAATNLDPTRTLVLPGGDPNATRVDADPNATRLDLPPAETVADALGVEAGRGGVRRAAWRRAFHDTAAWARRRWIMLAVSSMAVFAVVMAGITILEKVTDRPASGWVGANDGRGTTWGNLGDGGGTDGAPAETPSPRTTGETGEPTGTPSTGGQGTEPGREPTPGATDGPAQPGPPTPQPSSQPTAPSTPEPPRTGDPGGGTDQQNGPTGAGQ